MSDITNDFEKIFHQITTKKFLSMQALGGEEPFFIYSYEPQYQNTINKEIKRLKKRIKEKGLSYLSINLYDLSIELLKERRLLEKILLKEKVMPKYKLLQTLQNVLDTETKIIPKIKKLIQENKTDMLFLEGIGEVYPFIRSHTVINNLQKIVQDRPTLMFFPGVYDGYKLVLFGKIFDDNHYRAFNIIKYSFGE